MTDHSDAVNIHITHNTTFSSGSMLFVPSHPSQTPGMRYNAQYSSIHTHIVPALPACHFLPFNTVVIACLTTVPARSISFRDKPFVTQTLMPGAAYHSLAKSRGDMPSAAGMALRRVTRTPLARALKHCQQL